MRILIILLLLSTHASGEGCTLEPLKPLPPLGCKDLVAQCGCEGPLLLAVGVRTMRDTVSTGGNMAKTIAEQWRQKLNAAEGARNVKYVASENLGQPLQSNLIEKADSELGAVVEAMHKASVNQYKADAGIPFYYYALSVFADGSGLYGGDGLEIGLEIGLDSVLTSTQAAKALNDEEADFHAQT
jgi:hypothetical protein